MPSDGLGFTGEAGAGSSGSFGGGTGWIGLGAQLAATAADIYFADKRNKQMQDWNESMYGMQRSDALSDWERNAFYNSPEQIMARYRAAGLNPNLIYGSGTDTKAEAVRGTDVKSWSPERLPVGEGLRNALGSYHNFQIQEENLKTMQQARKNMEVDEKLKTLDIATKGINNAQNQFDLDQSRDLKDTVIAQANANLRATEQDTAVKASKEVRDAAMHSPNLVAAFQRVAQNELAIKMSSAQISQVNAQIEHLKKEGVLQDMEIAMRKLGLSYNDGVILRMLAQFAGGKSLPEVVRNGWDMIQKLSKGLRLPTKDVIDTN